MNGFIRSVAKPRNNRHLNSSISKTADIRFKSSSQYRIIEVGGQILGEESGKNLRSCDKVNGIPKKLSPFSLTFITFDES